MSDATPPPPPPPDAPPPGPPPGAPGGAGGAPTLVTRFLARLIDGLLVGIPMFIVNAILPFGFVVEGAINAVVYFGYFVYMEGQQGATIGKNVMNLKVQLADGQPMTQDASIQRNLWMLLGAVPILGGLASLAVVIYIAVTISGSANGRGWHDERAGAIVVSV